MRTFGIYEDEEVCANCKHYYQHYVKAIWRGAREFTAVNAGHCTHPRIKGRKPGDTCSQFENRVIIKEEGA